jgi:hypothetical protein
VHVTFNSSLPYKSMSHLMELRKRKEMSIFCREIALHSFAEEIPVTYLWFIHIVSVKGTVQRDLRGVKSGINL